MQTQVKIFRRTLTYIAKSALVLAGAGIAVWIPASIGDPGSNVVRAATAASSAQRASPTRKVRMSDVASGMRRCAHRVNPAAVTPRVRQNAENADLLILLDWHMTASNGYGFGLERASCSAKSVAPMPLEASEAYEILGHLGESTRAPARSGRDDAAAALRQETE